MAIAIDHLVVPARSPGELAVWWSVILDGVRETPSEGARLPWVAAAFEDVWLAGMRFRFASCEVTPQHYAFHVTPTEFDHIVARLELTGTPYGDSHDTEETLTNGCAAGLAGGNIGISFRDIEGHVLEVRTSRSEGPRL